MDDHGEQGDYTVGPVTLRRGQVPPTTTDQRLLDQPGPADWVHTDPWRVLRIQAEFVEGFGALAELGPAVSVFGSARTPVDHPDYALGERVGRSLLMAHAPTLRGLLAAEGQVVRTAGRRAVGCAPPWTPTSPSSRCGTASGPP